MKHLASYGLCALALAALLRPASGDVFQELQRVRPDAPKKVADWPQADREPEAKGSTLQLQFTKDGKRLVSLNGDYAIRFWEVSTGSRRPLRSH